MDDDFDLIEWLGSFPRRPIDLWSVTVKVPDQSRLYWSGYDWTTVQDLAAVYAGMQTAMHVVDILQNASPSKLDIGIIGAGERERTS